MPQQRNPSTSRTRSTRQQESTPGSHNRTPSLQVQDDMLAASLRPVTRAFRQTAVLQQLAVKQQQRRGEATAIHVRQVHQRKLRFSSVRLTDKLGKQNAEQPFSSSVPHKAQPAAKKRKTAVRDGADNLELAEMAAVTASQLAASVSSSPEKAAHAPKKKIKATAGKGPSIAITAESKAKALQIVQQLNQLYPDPPIPLNHTSPFQLLVAVVLSAQCTDDKVNQVTPRLFAAAADAHALASMQVQAIEDCIRQLGLAPTKARNLSAMSQILVEKYDGQVPATFEELEALPGVGHKTASVVLSQAFGKLAFPVDTHIHRLAQRWGLTAPGQSVEQTEVDLKELVPEQFWRTLHLQIIYFGRQHCPAQRHDPTVCPVCSWAAVPPFDRPGLSPAKPGKKEMRISNTRGS